MVKNFLDSNPDSYCLYFDTEAAVNKGLLESRGIDLKRLVVVNVVTIEEFRNKLYQKMKLVKEVMDENPNGPYKKILREQHNMVA